MVKGTDFIIGAVVSGTAVYFLFPQVKDFLVGGEYSGAGGGTSGFIQADSTDGQKAVTSDGTILDGALTKKQLSFITSNLDTSLGASSLNTYKFDNGYSASILSTPSGNEKALTSDIDLFAGTNTLFSYTKKGKVVGGSDFKNLQSVTSSRASSSSGSKEKVASFASSSTPASSSSTTKKTEKIDYSKYASGGSSSANGSSFIKSLIGGNY